MSKECRLLFKAMMLCLIVCAIAIQLASPVAAAITSNCTLAKTGSVSADGDGVYSIATSIVSASGTVTITNNTSDTRIYVIDYSVTISNSDCYVQTSSKKHTASATGQSYTVTLEGGAVETITIYCDKAWGSRSASITFTNISDSKVVTADVKFASHDTDFATSSVGSYTISGVTASDYIDQDAVFPNYTSTDGVTVAATTVSGYDFIGWVNTETNEVFSEEMTATLRPEVDCTIAPVYISSTSTQGLYLADSILYPSWETAFAGAGSSTVILLRSCTLPAGTYTIGSGQKLLIPYNAKRTEHFDESPNMVSVATPTVYRTLTLADGAVIQCNGSINVGGQVSAESSSYAGRPTGAYGRINMLGENSKLILASADSTNSTAGTLYCYGFIIGSGEVVAQSGASVYETFDACGFRGGTTTSGAWLSSAGLEKTYKSFLFSEYSVHNIELDFALESGASWYTVASIAPSTGDTIQASAQFAGTSSGMFQMGTNATVLRSYDPNTDRTTFTLNGTVNLTGFVLSMGGTSLDTSQFILGINGGWDVVIESGTLTVGSPVKLMPGTTLTIEENGKMLVNDKMYLYDAVDYAGKGYVYYRCKDGSYAFPYVEAYNCMPTQYIATTNKSYSHISDSFARTIGADDHTKVVVNGTLEVGSDGGVYTTSNGGQSAGKVLLGEGTFINNSTTATGIVTDYLDELTWYYESWYSYGLTDNNITVTPAVGLIKGLSTSTSDYRCFEAGKTYHGSSDGYWYEYTISTVEDGVTTENIAQLGNGSTITFNDSNVASELTAANGNYSFYAYGYDVTTDNGELSRADDGQYTLTAVTDDVTLTYTAHTCTDADGDGDHTCDECGATNATSCTPSTTWSSDATNHWHDCTECGADSSIATHSDATGDGDHACDVCSRADVTSHSYSDATCTVAATCSECKATTGSALGHTYGDVSYTWGDTTSCTASHTCTRTNCGNVETATSTGVSSAVKTAATCTTMGTTTYTANFGVDWATAQTKDVQDIAVDSTAHADSNTDHVCDNGCGKTDIGTHADGEDANHTCDYCQGAVEGETCADANSDHKCDECGETTSTCVDKDTNHECDYSGCKAAMGTHTNGTNTHTCAYCGQAASTCSDALGDGNHECDVCGVVVGECDSDTEIPAVAATCTTTGLTAGTKCSECGTVQTAQETVAALGHSYGTSEYTWSDDGKSCTAKRTCARTGCTHSETATASAEGKVTTDATCTVMGTTTYTATFSVDWATEQTTTRQDVAVIAHTYNQEKIEDTYKATDATCTAKATYYYSCSCGAAGTETFEHGEANGHIPGAEATCTAAQTCTVCGAELAAKLGHSYESVVTAPTCTAGGYTTHTCSRCSDSYTDSAVAANGHNLGEWIVDAAATCTEAGSQHKECENCDYTESGTIEALGHDEETHAAQAPTCTAIGWDAYVTCSRCDYSTYAEKSSLGHDEVNHEAQAPTCTEIGWEAYVTCSRCDYSTYAEKAALGHDMVTDAAVEATCTATGLTEGSHCSRCDGATTAQEVVPAKGHTDADSDGDHICDRDGCSEVVSTCGDSGKDHICDSDSACTVYSTGDNAHADSDSDKDHVCDYCGKEVENGETCSDVTTDNDHSCDVCGKENVTSHSYDAVVTAPTHIAAGYTTYTCNCGDTYTSDQVAALGHSYTSSVTTEPTCTEAGVRTYTCECGHSYSETIEATGHKNTVTINAKAATCGTDGYTGDTYCNDCKTTIATGTAIEATGEHDYTWATTTAATCVATGVETGTCSCGAETTREIAIDSNAHDLVTVEAKVATCTEAGYTAHTDCSRCDHTEGYEVVPATGHVNTTTTTVDATCTEDGSVTVTCACGHVVSTEVIKSEGHSYGEPSYTWTDTTLTVTLTCGNCAEGTEGHELTGSADGAVESSTEGDCKTEATTTYTATVTLNGQDYTDETTIKGELGNHSYVNGTCTVCGTADPDASTTTKPTVTVTDPANGTVIAYDIVEAESGWTLTLTAKDTANTYVYLVKYTDADGNISEKQKNASGKYSDGEFAIPAGASAVTVQSVLRGDVTCDGAIKTGDYKKLKDYLTGKIELEKLGELGELAADVTGDGLIKTGDYKKLKDYLTTDKFAKL